VVETKEEGAGRHRKDSEPQDGTASSPNRTTLGAIRQEMVLIQSIVQPGISKANITDDQRELLGTTELYLHETRSIPFQVISSA